MTIGEDHYAAFRKDLASCTTKFTRRRSSLKGLMDHMWGNRKNPHRFYSRVIAINHCKNPKDARIIKYHPAIDRMVSCWGTQKAYPANIAPKAPRRVLPPLPPPRIRARGPLIMGMAHPTRTRTRRDEVIADTGQVYRTYRQSKSHSCGPTCCLIVLMNYFSSVEYTEKDMRERLTGYIGGYRPYGGTDMDSLATMLNGEEGLTATYRIYTSYQELRDSTPRISGQLYPAITRIQWGPNGGGHFVVVVETVGNKFMVLDPGKGHVQPLTEDDLNNYDGAGYWDGKVVTSF